MEFVSCSAPPSKLEELEPGSLEFSLPPTSADQSVDHSGFQIASCPHPYLTYLSLGCINIIDSEPIAWIMSPRSRYSCTSLQLCLNNMLRGRSPLAPLISRDLRPLLRRMNSTVTKLRLVKHKPEDDISSVMELFPCLRSWTSPDRLTLTTSIDTFHFHYASQFRIDERECTRCLALIKASPSVRKILITYTVERD